jgi:hypothetical protein
MTSKTIKAAHLTTRHRIVTAVGEFGRTRQALAIAEVGVSSGRVEVVLLHDGGIRRRTYAPNDRVRVTA